MPDDNANTFLTPREVAQLFKLNILTIYEYIHQGEIICVKFGRSYRIRLQDLNNFISRHLTSKTL